MNNIQEMDWAEDCWHGHTGMDSSSDYCTNEDTGPQAANGPASSGEQTAAEGGDTAAAAPPPSR